MSDTGDSCLKDPPGHGRGLGGAVRDLVGGAVRDLAGRVVVGAGHAPSLSCAVRFGDPRPLRPGILPQWLPCS